METTRLANGCEAVGPLLVPEGIAGKAVCLCGFQVRSAYLFVKEGAFWIRALHTLGAGFCEMPVGQFDSQAMEWSVKHRRLPTRVPLKEGP